LEYIKANISRRVLENYKKKMALAAKTKLFLFL